MTRWQAFMLHGVRDVPSHHPSSTSVSPLHEERSDRPNSWNVWAAVVIVGVVLSLVALTWAGVPGRMMVSATLSPPGGALAHPSEPVRSGMTLPPDPQRRAHLDADGTFHQYIELEETLVLGVIPDHFVLAPGDTDTSEAGAVP